ncbi:sphingosine kinase 1-like isoform X1 [Senna tora]|uniref:sphingosine kinase n=1 Tax=Senna tora TaxID=362788 RepID=A0A834W019_9FABA|nr:sphingosine kinase 1-like isoform X1 [Senna tora]
MDRPDCDKPVFSERVIVDGTVTPVSLFSDGTLWCLSGGQRCLTLRKEVLGFVTDGPNIRIKTVIETRDCCFPGNRGKLVRNEIVFQSLSEESQRLWCQNLREYIDSLGRPKKLFIFLNPFGGKKTATNIFLDHVKPLLEDAEIQITVQETKYQLHAKEVARTLDVSQYDGIVCVSGDGILVEVVNGILEREDWETAIKTPLGVIPAGTGNGMAKSLLDSVGNPCTPAHAVLSIIQGHKRPLDVATIRQGETTFFSVLMLAWGLVADIDIESEKYRWMGSARIDFYALTRIFRLRHYNGCVSFVPAPGFEGFGEPTSYPGKFTSKVDNKCDPSEVEANKLQKCCYQGTDINLENLNWRVINGPFISIWLHNVPWGGENTMAAPDAKVVLRWLPGLDYYQGLPKITVVVNDVRVK